MKSGKSKLARLFAYCQYIDNETKSIIRIYFYLALHMHSAPSASLPKCCSSQHVNTLDDVYPRRHAEDFLFSTHGNRIP